MCNHKATIRYGWGQQKDNTAQAYPANLDSHQAPDDGVPPVADAMVLEDRVLEDLKAHGFSVKSIKYWLDKKDLSINARDKTGRPLLMYPVWYSPEISMIKIYGFMIDQGADINTEAECGLTILHLAAVECYEPLIDFLLKNGADPCAKIKEGIKTDEIPLLKGLEQFEIKPGMTPKDFVPTSGCDEEEGAVRARIKANLESAEQSCPVQHSNQP